MSGFWKDTEESVEDETLSNEEDIKVLNMPDDEFATYTPETDKATGDESTEETLEEEIVETEEETTTTEETTDEEVNSDDESNSTQEEENKENAEAEEGTGESSENTEQDTESENKEQDVEDNKEPVKYDEFYKDIMKPFKANGKMITPESKEDVISLMQMGANYVKKMATIKPALKVLSSLEKNNIDEEELNFLIDIKNKNPEAIKKLLKDSKLDMYEFDPEKDIDYKPSNNLATEEEAIFNQTVKEIQDSPHFDTTKRIVTQVWDKGSREKLLKNPDLLVGLHQEIEMERFDKVQSIVDRERTFGRLQGMSDLDAYMVVVNKLVQEETNSTPVSKPKQEPVQVTQTVTKTVDKSKAKPSPSKASPSKVKYTDEDILNMSDEDFQKLERKKLY
jgi:hypothetical protein